MDELKKLLQSNIDEIKENKIRFVALCICFLVVVILFFSDENSGGEEIIISEASVSIENPDVAENVSADKKVFIVKNSATSNADKSITVVLGANSDSLYVHDPFKFPVEEKIEPLAPVEIPTVQPVIIAPPVAQESPKPAVKFILRGTAIIGDKKSALIQIISDNKNSDAENLILEIGEIINGKKIIDISQDFIIFDDGETVHLDIQTP